MRSWKRQTDNSAVSHFAPKKRHHLWPFALGSWPCGPLAFGTLALWPFSSSALWPFGPLALALWPFGPLALWPFGPLALWLFGPLVRGPLAIGLLTFWPFGFSLLALWPFGPWPFAPLPLQPFGPLALWPFGLYPFGWALGFGLCLSFLTFAFCSLPLNTSTFHSPGDLGGLLLHS